MARFRVSHLASYARWRDDEESDVGWLLNSIMNSKPTPQMEKGTAFHKYLERAQAGTDVNEFTVNGYRFVFTCDIEIALPQMREVRRDKDYGGIVVTGCADAPDGKTIIDHKTTSHFDAENYLEGWQHKFYMDIFEANRFVWYVWEMSEIGQEAYEVYGFHVLTQYRYPAMEDDCRKLAVEFRDFAAKWLPGYSFTDGEQPAPAISAKDVSPFQDQLRASL